MLDKQILIVSIIGRINFINYQYKIMNNNNYSLLFDGSFTRNENNVGFLDKEVA